MSIDIPNTLTIIMVIAHFDLEGQEQADVHHHHHHHHHQQHHPHPHKKVIAHFDLVGQEQADGLQALLSSEKETSSIIYLELTDGVDDDVDDKVDEDCVENLST